MPITGEILRRVEQAEDQLFQMGYTDFRVRVLEGAARLQFPQSQLERAFREREAIRQALGETFPEVLLDLKTR